MIERVDNNGNSYEAARVVSIAFEEPEILAETLKAVGGMVAACINGNSPERVTLRRTETCCFLDIEETVHSDGVTMLLYFAAGQIAAGEMFLFICPKKHLSEGASMIWRETKASLELYREGILRLALDLIAIGEIEFTDAANLLIQDEDIDEDEESATEKRTAVK